VSGQPILTNYVTDLDKFLQEFDKQQPKLTASQQKEHDKYKRISKLRDTEERSEENKDLWEGF
jgi:hypothetical protein